jgi:1-acyl-sn-glycerol-3-phosphate acyltransferase
VKSINAAAENVKNNICSMAIYPEGTRNKAEGMLPFHAGSFKIATKSGAPIVVSTVEGTELVSKNAPFKRTVINLKICEVFSSEEVLSSTTAELAEKARKIMCDSLGIS